jgi:hypothetical protein
MWRNVRFEDWQNEKEIEVYIQTEKRKNSAMYSDKLNG